MDIRFKRVMAFVIDMLLVMLLTMMVVDVDYLNPCKYDYESTYENYQDVYMKNYDKLIENKVEPQEFIKEIAPKMYKLSRTLLFQNLWYLVFFMGYNVLFAFFTNGQTLGKKMLKIKVVNKGDNKAKSISLLIRSLFNGNSLYLGVNISILLNIIMLFVLKDAFIYFYVYTIVMLLSSVLELADILCFMIRKDHLALHDLIAKTEVVAC